MIESLGEHGVMASDLVPALMSPRTEYGPEEARRKAEDEIKISSQSEDDDDDDASLSNQTLVNEPSNDMRRKRNTQILQAPAKLSLLPIPMVQRTLFP